jgi:hypothetical protein
VQAADRLRGLRLVVLDALSLIEHDDVVVSALVRGELGVAGKQLIVHQLQRALRAGPAESPRGGVPGNHFEGQVRRPGPQLAHPVGDQRLGTDKQGIANQRRVEHQPKRQDRLHRLAQPHLVRQHGRVPRHQKGDSFHLVRVRLERHRDVPAAEDVF